MGNNNINLGLSIIIISVSLVVVLTLLPNSAPVSADSDSTSDTLSDSDSNCKSVEGLWITHPQPPEDMALYAIARTDETGKICVEFSFIPIAEDEAGSNRDKNNPNFMRSIIFAYRNKTTLVLVDSDSDFECKKTLGGMIRLPQPPEGMASRATTKIDENGCAVTKFSFTTIAEMEARRDEIRNLPNINTKTISASWNATSSSNLDNETSEESP